MALQSLRFAMPTNTAIVLDCNHETLDVISLSAALEMVSQGRAEVFREYPYTIIQTTGATGQAIAIGDSGNGALTLSGHTLSFNLPSGATLHKPVTVNPAAANGLSIDANQILSFSPSGTASVEPWRVVGRSGQPAYQGEWVAYTAASSYAPARFRKIGKTVELQGLIAGGAASLTQPDAIAFTLPDGYRPSARLVKTGQAGTGMARFDIAVNGEVRIARFFSGGNNSHVSLHCSFGID